MHPWYWEHNQSNSSTLLQKLLTGNLWANKNGKNKSISLLSLPISNPIWKVPRYFSVFGCTAGAASSAMTLDTGLDCWYPLRSLITAYILYPAHQEQVSMCLSNLCQKLLKFTLMVQKFCLFSHLFTPSDFQAAKNVPCGALVYWPWWIRWSGGNN